MNQKPVFVLITAEVCSACQHFKNNIWFDLKKELENQGKVKIVTINLPTLNSKPDTTKYHPDLKRYVGWFPTMSLFPASSWYNKSSELKGVIKDGQIIPSFYDENGQFKSEHVEKGKIILSKDSVLNWIDNTIKNFKTQKSNTLKYNVPTSGYYSKFKHSKVK